MFGVSQILLFSSSFKIATATHGRINGSMFATMVDLMAVGLLYKFWNSITDGRRDFFDLFVFVLRLIACIL